MDNGNKLATDWHHW